MTLSIFYLSFYKTPKTIIDELRIFLEWSRVEERRKTIWISWEKICLPKVGDLGIKHCGKFNLALLCKWKWRILNGVSASWFNLLSYRYGNIKRFMICEPCPSLGSKVSIWWKDVCIVGSSQGHRNWFIDSIASKVGNGDFIDFWCDKWLGPEPLCSIFISLFVLVDMDRCNIA